MDPVIEVTREGEYQYSVLLNNTVKYHCDVEGCAHGKVDQIPGLKIYIYPNGTVRHVRNTNIVKEYTLEWPPEGDLQ